ncbi:MAG: ABC transporter ATP-binding protein [Armatimonadota bacterium]
MALTAQREQTGIAIRGVNHAYPGGTLPVLAGVDLEFAPGSFTCFVGPSGCGKSTLCRMIAGLERPADGGITINGQPVDGPGENRVLMFQDAGLFPWLNVLDNVLFGLRMQRQPKEVAQAHAMNCLRLVQLSRFATSYPHELSGGMRQRVALARALAVRPSVLLMDEPFGALDAQTREILLVELERIWQATGTTIVYVTHNVSEAVILGTQAVIFTARPGRIRGVVPLADLPRPRATGDAGVIRMTEVIYAELKDEIERVEREEFDLGWHLETGAVPRRAAFDLGDGI